MFEHPIPCLYSPNDLSTLFLSAALIFVFLLCCNFFVKASNTSISGMACNARPFPGTTKKEQFMFVFFMINCYITDT